MTDGDTILPEPVAGPAAVTDPVVLALLALVAERPWWTFDIAAVAERAGEPLEAVRARFDGRRAVLAALFRAIDQAVLATDRSDMAEEKIRDRIFDMVLRRFDAMTPYKAGIAGLVRSARRDPALALTLARLGVLSSGWMLAGAGVSIAGPMGDGKVLLQAAIFARVLPVWLEDDDPGLARTMAALDRELIRVGKVGRRVKGVLSALKPFSAAADAYRSARDGVPPGSSATSGPAA